MTSNIFTEEQTLLSLFLTYNAVKMSTVERFYSSWIPRSLQRGSIVRKHTPDTPGTRYWNPVAFPPQFSSLTSRIMSRYPVEPLEPLIGKYEFIPEISVNLPPKQYSLRSGYAIPPLSINPDAFESSRSIPSPLSPLSPRKDVEKAACKGMVSESEKSTTPMSLSMSLSTVSVSEDDSSLSPWKLNNRLSHTVATIAAKHGHDPFTVVPLFRHLSSTDFCLGAPQWKTQFEAIPGGVWKDVANHYNLSQQKPYVRLSSDGHPTIFKEKSPVFVSRKYTEKLIGDSTTMERFTTSQRLYQYLNWTMRINKVSKTMNLLEGKNGSKVLLINTELHDHQRRELYALCIANDVVSAKAQKWQLASLFTASELSQSLGIDYQHFPRGVRASSPQFEQYRAIRAGALSSNPLKALKQQICERDVKRKMIRYQQLKCVLAGNGRNSKRRPCPENILTVHLSSFYAKVRAALESPHIDLIPMVSIVSKKLYQRKEEDFSVDYLLPVPVGQDWVGVVYRDMEPIMALMDDYDITNKAILCDPGMDAKRLPFKGGAYNRLKILPDHQWDTSSMEWILMYSNVYFEQFRPKKTKLVPPNYHC